MLISLVTGLELFFQLGHWQTDPFHRTIELRERFDLDAALLRSRPPSAGLKSCASEGGGRGGISDGRYPAVRQHAASGRHAKQNLGDFSRQIFALSLSIESRHSSKDPSWCLLVLAQCRHKARLFGNNPADAVHI